jgi:hypothetical protein
MKKLLRIIFLVVFVLLFSCEEVAFLVYCPDCLKEEPSEAGLELKLEEGPNYAITVVNIWEGNLEDSILYKSFDTFSSKRTIKVPVNKKFTVTASYGINGIRYVAVNSTTLRTKYDKESCEEPCYFVFGRKLDLRLK